MSDQPLGADPTDAHTSGLPAAVLGTGQTHHVSRRTDVSMAGLCREAIDAAMADAGVGWDDIDAVIVGKAPDLFEGVMMPELMMADALGAVGKPLLRVHTAGSVGGSTAIVGTSTGTAPCSAIRSLISADCALVRGTSTFQPNMARDSHHWWRCRSPADLPMVTTRSPSMSRPISAMVARVPSADFWAHSEPEQVTVTGVPADRPCSARLEAASARWRPEVRRTIGPGELTSADQSTFPRPSAKT